MNTQNLRYLEMLSKRKSTNAAISSIKLLMLLTYLRAWYYQEYTLNLYVKVPRSVPKINILYIYLFLNNYL